MGSGTAARLFSLARDASKAAKETVWKEEPGSVFPALYRKYDGRRCLGKNFPSRTHDKITYDLFPNQRQSVGIASTTEGLWMLGGMLQPAADIPGGGYYERFVK